MSASVPAPSSTSPSTPSTKSCSGCPLSRDPADSQKDDWAWTLRSAANRPLLRWLEDGPLVVVSDGTGAAPKLKARLMATGQAGTFGESGERFSASVEDTPSNGRELLARVDFAPNTDAGLESMLGFRQDLGFAGSVQSVAAVAIRPEIEGPAENWDSKRLPFALGKPCASATNSRWKLAQPKCWGALPISRQIPWSQRCPMLRLTGEAANQKLAIGWQP